MNDTSPAMEATFRRIMMQRSGEERMRMASDMLETTRRLVLASLSPGLSAAEQRDALLLRFYGQELDTHVLEAVRKRLSTFK